VTAFHNSNTGYVLVVDEEDESRTLTVDVLTEAGYATRQTASGKEAIAIARRERPRVVALEVCLGEICGYEVCGALRAEFGNELPVMFVSGARTEWFDRVAGLLIGADDYLVKPFAPGELVARVAALARRADPTAVARTSKLTRRELEVLNVLAEGLSKAGIAGRLSISEKTVGTHVQNIFAKLGVQNRVQAAALAQREDLAVR
jgi:DNA-binding NarL/FixJ family response regulator